eukprot:2455376-Prymnesium_polylepis.1
MRETTVHLPVAALYGPAARRTRRRASEVRPVPAGSDGSTRSRPVPAGSGRSRPVPSDPTTRITGMPNSSPYIHSEEDYTIGDKN